MCSNLSFSSFKIMLAALRCMSAKTDYTALQISSFSSWEKGNNLQMTVYPQNVEHVLGCRMVNVPRLCDNSVHPFAYSSLWSMPLPSHSLYIQLVGVHGAIKVKKTQSHSWRGDLDPAKNEYKQKEWYIHCPRMCQEGSQILYITSAIYYVHKVFNCCARTEVIQNCCSGYVWSLGRRHVKKMESRH